MIGINKFMMKSEISSDLSCDNNLEKTHTEIFAIFFSLKRPKI